jgi:alkylation response protein AidB-like acyl-CoA dehydrogenase
MVVAASQRERQVKEAEELLFSERLRGSFAKDLFFGRFNAALIRPYPTMSAQEQPVMQEALVEVQSFCQERIDPAKIDREADIPRDVIKGLGNLGVLSWTIPAEYGGKGMSQYSYCKVMEIVGGHDAAVGILVNAHQSIGLRGILLAGSKSQREQWLPRLVTGAELAAFALTEPEAGSDAANVQTRAELTSDGSAYILNGQKRYITNGAIASVLTVMARTAIPGSAETKVSAFLVTPDMPGFKVIEARQPKCGIRGTATAKLAFENMRVPSNNLLGQLGKGLRLALSVLDFGRTTFGACCTGGAKEALQAAVRHANSRRQFGQTLGEFEMVKKKLAHMAADIFAMESATYHCASLIDRGLEDYMVETAMLKVFASEALWRIVNDTIQIFGGQAYFSDEPYERMMRDARINLIGEGANDVMRAFIAVVGMRDVGMMFKDGLDALMHPVTQIGQASRFVGSRLGARLWTPFVQVDAPLLKAKAARLGKRIKSFSLAVEGVLRKYREAVLDRQYVQERLADAAIELYLSSCVLSRLDSALANERQLDLNGRAGLFYLDAADERVERHLYELWHNHDEGATEVANWLLNSYKHDKATRS